MFLIEKIKKLYGSIVNKIIDLYLDMIIAKYKKLEKSNQELMSLIDELQKEVDNLHKQNSQ